MTRRFTVERCSLDPVRTIERTRVGDDRGFLERLFCSEELAAAGWHKPIAQINRTMTAARGTVRGMHFQRAPHTEAKLVTCLRGAIFDVAVDLRRNSPTFGKWVGAELSADNGRALLVPEGFAHGFQTLVDGCELIYLHSAPYVPAAEGGVRPEDPALGITWPLPVAGLSQRDASHPPLTSTSEGIDL